MQIFVFENSFLGLIVVADVANCRLKLICKNVKDRIELKPLTVGLLAMVKFN